MWVCEACGKEFSDEKSLGAHILRKHQKIGKKIEFDEAQQVYLDNLEREAAFFERKAELQRRIQKAAESINAPTIEQRLMELFRMIEQLTIRVKKLEAEIDGFYGERQHDLIMERLIKMLGE